MEPIVFTTPNTMSLNEYQRLAATTAIYPGRGNVIGLLYAAIGLAGEAGEHAEKVKKLLREDTAAVIVSLVETLRRVPDNRLEAVFSAHMSAEDAALLARTLNSLCPMDPCIDESRRQQALGELGDVMWYVAESAAGWGFTLEEVAKANVAKLFSRKERGKLHGNGDER